MESLEVNKAFAAVLVAGIAFMGATLIADGLVSYEPLAKPAIAIPASGPAVAAAPAAAPLAAIGPLLAKADPDAGAADVKKLCSVCHTFTEGGKAGVGPNLYGVVGGPHAHMEGYSYSNAIKGKQGPWTFDELNQWLHKPSAYAPGTKMGFAGITDDKERADVIDYLHTLSHSPLPLPEAGASAAAPGSTAAPTVSPKPAEQAPAATAPVAAPK